MAFKEITLTVNKDLYMRMLTHAQYSGELNTVENEFIKAAEYMLKKFDETKREIVYHHDAGHGWYAVNHKQIIKLGLLYVISSCSYMRSGTVYLEEDRDAEKFFIAYFESMGEDVSNIDSSKYHRLKEKYFTVRNLYKERSPIRGYACYSGNQLALRARKGSYGVYTQQTL